MNGERLNGERRTENGELAAASVPRSPFPVLPTIWLLLSAVIIAIVAFCHLPESSYWHTVIPLDGHCHVAMMLGGTAAVALLALACRLAGRSGTVHRGRLVAVTIGLAIVQTLMVHSYYFFTDWDVQQVTGLAQAMAEGKPVDDYSFYFRESPNNLLLARLFAFVFFVTGPLLHHPVSLFPLLLLQCLAAAVTALMLFQTAMHIFRRKDCALMAYLFYLLLVWLSPWWSIPYSDVWGLVLSVFLLWLATTLPFRHRWLRIALCAALTAVGYYIRPQIVFVSLSLAAVWLVSAIRGRTGFRAMLKPAGTAMAGLVAGVLLAHLAVAGSGMHLHTSKAFGPTHFLMLGANSEYMGVYSDDDVDFSRRYPDKGERQRAELAETLRRYSEMGIKGSFTLWGQKTLLNFSDGTFYWGREGQFYKEVPQRDGWLAKATASVYYNRGHRGRFYTAWSVVATSLWFGLLVFSLIAVWPRRAESGKRRTSYENENRLTRRAESEGRKAESVFAAILLAVILLVLFHTFFEARARYLFCFVPFFIILAAGGLERIFKTKKR